MAVKDVIDRILRLDGRRVYLEEPYYLDTSLNDASGASGADAFMRVGDDETTYTLVQLETEDAGTSEIKFVDNNTLKFVIGYLADEFSISAYGVGSAMVVDHGTASVGFPNGFGFHAGSQVTQLVGITTAVALNAYNGRITTVTAPAIAAGAEAEFTFTNTLIASTDVVVLTMRAQFTDGVVIPYVKSMAAGSCVIGLTNVSAAAVSAGAAQINFVVIKASNG